MLENLNTAVDHPGTPFARAADTSPWSRPSTARTCKLMLDLYHAQIGEGNLIELLRRRGPAIGEIQVADVPGRCEPGTGEINYPAVARALAEMGYSRHGRAGGLRLGRQRTGARAVPDGVHRLTGSGCYWR